MTDRQYADLMNILKRIDGHLETLVGLAGGPHKSDSIDLKLVEQAKNIVIQFDTASASFLQRKLGIGYASAARTIDKLEEMGIVGPAIGSTPRKVLQKK